MSAGFCILTLSARWSAMYGHSSLPLMVLGLAVMGFAKVYRPRLPCRKLRDLEFWA
ncbi:hypothetical protein ACLK11_03950 [Escherichia coli]